MTYVLWIIQALLALIFLFAGGTKLALPPDVLASMGSPNQVPLPGRFVRSDGFGHGPVFPDDESAPPASGS